MANIEEGISKEEFELAQQMKNDYCDESGKETNPAKAAEIIHQIGQIYRKRSPDKISLIKSAGLFNAAIVRNPINIFQIKSDLFEICQHILHQAKAKDRNANLVKKAENVKSLINTLRNEVNEFFEQRIHRIPIGVKQKDLTELNLNKISAIKEVNKTIADKYKQIMADLSQFCEDVMGEPPCTYALAGMGSLARKEITPYSDFEHIILLCDEKKDTSYVEYFRWFSVIFHTVILNVQETIVPSLNVRSLNGRSNKDWFYDTVTPRGISFDGMMPHACKFPLGRQQHTENKRFSTELIKPVSEMLKYLASEADLKNGYHLSNILTNTCFVFGTKTVFGQFVNGVQEHRKYLSQIDTKTDVKHQIKDDLTKYSTRFLLNRIRSHSVINIKHLVYRSTTIFVAALARIHNISANSSFEIIDKMESNKTISENTTQKLKCAIAIACEMRLRVYMEKNSQYDSAIDLKKDGINTFLEIVGLVNIVNYFQISYCLQCEVAKQLKLTKFYFHFDPQLINLTIGLAFGMRDLSCFSNKRRKFVWDSSEFDFDACIEQLVKQSRIKSSNSLLQKINKELSKKIYDSKNVWYLPDQFHINPNKTKNTANYLLSKAAFDEAIELYKILLEFYRQESKNSNCNNDMAWTNYQLGLCSTHLNQHENALNYFNEAVKVKQNASSEKDRIFALSLYEIGCIHNYCSHKCNTALTYLEQALHIFENIASNPEKNWDIFKILLDIGRCHIELHNYNDASTYLNREIKIEENALQNSETNSKMYLMKRDIGRCYMYLCNFPEALIHLSSALEIKRDRTQNAAMDFGIAWTHLLIGVCHAELYNFTDALSFLEKSLEINQNVTIDEENDFHIGRICHEIGRCHIGLHNYNAPKTRINRALEIEQNAAPCDKKNKLFEANHETGGWHVDLHGYEKALINLEKALKIKQNRTFNSYKDRDLAMTKCVLGECLAGLQQYDGSWKYLNQALQIFQNTTLDKEKDIRIAETFACMSKCSLGEQKFEEAIAYLEKALNIYQNLIP